jgi:hypothetical protein
MSSAPSQRARLATPVGLGDAIVPQGMTLVGRGLDHFLADPDPDRAVAAMAKAVLATLEDGDGRWAWSGATGGRASPHSKMRPSRDPKRLPLPTQ